jgi:6-phosphogluconate dehydrogenase
LIAEAVFARCLSAQKEERVRAANILPQANVKFSGDKETAIKAIGDAVYAAKIISYAQGFGLMRAAEKEYGWQLNYGGIALMWRGGCIIRSQFLNDMC